jgi:hypothetical protein
MSSSIKLDKEFSLVVELKFVVVDTRYFIRLTSVGNFQTQSRQVKTWIHIEYELRQVNSNNFAKNEDPAHSSWKKKLWVSFVASYLCLEPCENTANT